MSFVKSSNRPLLLESWRLVLAQKTKSLELIAKMFQVTLDFINVIGLLIVAEL